MADSIELLGVGLACVGGYAHFGGLGQAGKEKLCDLVFPLCLLLIHRRNGRRACVVLVFGSCPG